LRLVEKARIPHFGRKIHMQAKLRLISGNPVGKQVDIPDGTLTVGRAEDSGLIIASTKVSRHHCDIINDGAQLILRDHGSGNGTLVNGQKISEAALNVGDEVAIGPLTFVVEIEGVSERQDIPVAEEEPVAPVAEAPIAARPPAVARPAAPVAPVIRPAAPVAKIAPVARPAVPVAKPAAPVAKPAPIARPAPVAKPAPVARPATPVAKPAPVARPAMPTAKPAAPVKGVPVARPAAAKPAAEDFQFPAPKRKPPAPAKTAGKPGDIFSNLEALAGGKKPLPKELADDSDDSGGGKVLRISEEDLIDPPDDKK
jgi:pSer/pThr/pTyr-binding forkhead associated (FHA) protein